MKKKCVIYNKLSNSNYETLQLQRDELIKYCKDKLKIKDYDIYDEASTDKNQFNEMMKKIDEKEFTDILVSDLYNIYRISYNDEKFGNTIDKILSSNIKLHCIEGDVNKNINYLAYKNSQE